MTIDQILARPFFFFRFSSGVGETIFLLSELTCWGNVILARRDDELGGRARSTEARCWESPFSFVSSCWRATCISTILPETPDAARLSLLPHPPGLSALRLPKNLVFRLGEVEPAILCRSENEVVEYALGIVGLFSPMLEDKILVGRRDD